MDSFSDKYKGQTWVWSEEKTQAANAPLSMYILWDLYAWLMFDKYKGQTWVWSEEKTQAA